MPTTTKAAPLILRDAIESLAVSPDEIRCVNGNASLLYQQDVEHTVNRPEETGVLRPVVRGTLKENRTKRICLEDDDRQQFSQLAAKVRFAAAGQTGNNEERRTLPWIGQGAKAV